MYNENISLKIQNNAGVAIPIQVMAGFNTQYGSANKTILVYWDLTTEDFVYNQILLTTVPPQSQILESQDLDGVVQALNKMNVATFFRVGAIIYATALLNLSCETADICITDEVFDIGSGFPAFVTYSTIQSDGKILVTGGFTTYDGQSSPYITRINSNGSMDTSFAFGTGFNLNALVVKVQSDGKILVGGGFTTYNGTGANRIIRLNSDGTVDGTFVYGTGFDASVTNIAIQSDGKILVVGVFNDYNGTGAVHIIRLNTDGTVDGTFVYGTGFDNTVNIVTVQSDGKILVGGLFADYNGTGANRIIRLNSDGTVDGTFVYGTGFNAAVNSITVQSDGKILVGGNFTTYNGTGANRIIRLNTDGTVDGTFVYGTGFASGTVEDMQLQPNGKIIIGGLFSTYNGINAVSIIRLNTDGTVDGTFVYSIGFNASVVSISIQSDGKIISVGTFTSYNGQPVNRIIRLTAEGLSDTIAD